MGIGDMRFLRPSACRADVPPSSRGSLRTIRLRRKKLRMQILIFGNGLSEGVGDAV